MTQNDGKQNKKPNLPFVNLATMCIVVTKQTENILLSTYRHQRRCYDKLSVYVVSASIFQKEIKHLFSFAYLNSLQRLLFTFAYLNSLQRLPRLDNALQN